MRALAALLLVLTSSSASALDAEAREAARAVIARQADALKRGDAAEAYAQAAPVIQGLFPTPEIFLGMVRNSYPPVYRHRTFVFGEAKDLGDAALAQEVAIQDEAGVDWTARYSLARGDDGRWRITGCHIAEAPGTRT